MSRSVACAALVALAAACASPPSEPAATPGREPQISGTFAVAGLSAPVQVVRDRWGVPHITARSEADLFFAQGFVQAQDRLFQMDLWRRSSQGRLSEVLGSNFIARDAMTRRVQYRGDPDAEWESYGPDVRAIAIAFTRGINAWVRHVAAALPEEFALAGWAPELWAPEDLLSRTDAFVASGDAEDEVFRARLAVAVGRSRAHALLQPGERAGATPAGLALDVVSPVVGDAVRRVGTSPFFMSLAVPPVAPRGSNAWALSAGRTETGAPLLAADPHAPLDNPSLRYVIHLRAPGWNVVGATAPWLPGVVIGHNERLAWGLTLAPADTQDVYVEQLNPANSQQVRSVRRFVDIEVVRESIPVRGGEPFEVDHQFTRNGFVIATDTERHLLFTLRWSGAQPGTAGELAGAMLGRAQSEGQLRQALSRWKLPVAEFVYADVDGTIGRQVAGLMPVRREADGRLPLPGWDGRYTWQEWQPFERLARTSNPADGLILSANANLARLGRIREVLDAAYPVSVDVVRKLQQDTVAWNAQRLVPLLEPLRDHRPDVEVARMRLLQWDRTMSADSAEAVLYGSWERELQRQLALRVAPAALTESLARRLSPQLVSALTTPSGVFFDRRARPVERDRLLRDSLAEAVSRLARAAGGKRDIIFAHPLGITPAAASRYNVGPFPLPGYPDTVFATTADRRRAAGPSFRMIADLANWDLSLATNAPGQSGTPGSSHYRDLAPFWAAGEYFPLAFSDAAIEAYAESRLTLMPE